MARLSIRHVPFALFFAVAALARAEDGLVLENGLRVFAREVSGSERVAVLVLYRIGEGHDPEGRSGTGHLIEHLLVTAPARLSPRRTLEETAARYCRAFRARTGEGATLIGGVVERGRLEEELSDVAARMAALRPEEQDLERERAQIEDEIGAMWERTPALVAANCARDLVLEPPPGTRRGGTREGLAAADLALVRDRLARFYKPRNAILSIAGGIEPQEALALARRNFAAISPGERPPPPRRAAPRARAEAPVEIEIAIDPARPRARALERPLSVAVVPAPEPPDPDFAPFLVLAARLGIEGARARVLVSFEPLEDGRVAVLSTSEGAAALEAFLAAAARDCGRGAPSQPEADMAAVPVLGERRQNELEAALRPAACFHLGIDPGALRGAIGRVTAADMARVAGRYLAPGRAGIVTVTERRDTAKEDRQEKNKE
jgi:predicted Zn-dependent peptidase